VTTTPEGFEEWYRLVAVGADLGPDQPSSDDALRAWLQEVFRAHGPVAGDVVEVVFRLGQLALTERALAAVIGDLHRTTKWRPDVTVDDSDGAVRITIDGNVTTPSLSVAPYAVAAGFVEVAAYVQENVSDNAGAIWPVCSFHGFGLHPQINAGRAMWWCRPRDHPIAAIGELTS
jgi:hypothetical protein